MSNLRIHLTLSGRPLVNCRATVEGLTEPLQTDERGQFHVDLPDGKFQGVLESEGHALAFELVNAPGLKQVRIDIREPEIPLTDDASLEAMPNERYVPTKLLGAGGMGRVYRCRDSTLDRLVAVKILSDELSMSPAQRESFLSEARHQAKIKNPHLLDIYDVGVHQDRLYMVVQFVDGPNLEELLQAEQRLDAGSVASAGVQLAHALHAIHEAGVLHRDIKPSNGLLERGGRVYLGDFGLAKPISDFTDPRSRTFGTPAYMSPEQLQGLKLGPASDIYNLGATLFDLLTGSPPHLHADSLFMAMTLPPPNLLDQVPDAPVELAELLTNMMARSPKRRPSAEDVIEVLLPVASEIPYSDDAAYRPRLTSDSLGIGSLGKFMSLSTGPMKSRRITGSGPGPNPTNPPNRTTGSLSPVGDSSNPSATARPDRSSGRFMRQSGPVQSQHTHRFGEPDESSGSGLLGYPEAPNPMADDRHVSDVSDWSGGTPMPQRSSKRSLVPLAIGVVVFMGGAVGAMVAITNLGSGERLSEGSFGDKPALEASGSQSEATTGPGADGLVSPGEGNTADESNSADTPQTYGQLAAAQPSDSPPVNAEAARELTSLRALNGAVGIERQAESIARVYAEERDEAQAQIDEDERQRERERARERERSRERDRARERQEDREQEQAARDEEQRVQQEAAEAERERLEREAELAAAAEEPPEVEIEPVLIAPIATQVDDEEQADSDDSPPDDESSHEFSDDDDDFVAPLSF